MYILDEIIKPVIAEPRHELSRYAPKMFSMMLPTDQIKDVIGKGGKVIQDLSLIHICCQGEAVLLLPEGHSG